MASFTISTTAGGNAVSHPLNLGKATTAGNILEQDVYIRHNSTSDLHNVKVYAQPFSGAGYVGRYGETSDYLKVLEWGLTAGKGLIANMDAATASAPFDKQFKPGFGDSAVNGFELVKEAFPSTLVTVDGDFPVGEEAKLKIKLSIPATETATARRQVSLFLRFDL